MSGRVALARWKICHIDEAINCFYVMELEACCF